MKKYTSLVAAGLMLAALSTLPTQAGNIVLARMGGGSIFPNDAAGWSALYGTNNCDNLGVWTEQSDLGWTNTDDTFIAALTNAGHHVTAFWVNNNNISDSDLLRLNTNDLIILSFSINSGPMNMGSSGNTSALCNSTNTGHKWNTLITAPMMLTKANLGRAGSSRLGWFSSMSSNDWTTSPIGTQITPSDFDSANNLSTTASGKLTIVDHNNPLFAGITYTNDGGGNRVMSNYFTLDISQNLSNPSLANYFTPIPSIPYPGPGGVDWPLSPGTLYNRGNTPATLKVVVGGVEQGPSGPGSFTNDLSPGGRVLATMEFNPMTDPAATPADGDEPPQGTAPVPEPTWVVTGVAIAEWPEGSKAFRGCTDPDTGDITFCDDLGGYRMFIAAGARDPLITTQDPLTGGKATGFFAGAFDLSKDGEKIFRRAVDRAILKGSNPSLSVARNGGNTVVSWNPAVRTWKLQSSTDLSSWADVASGVSNNSYTVPGGAPAAQFFRLTVIL